MGKEMKPPRVHARGLLRRRIIRQLELLTPDPKKETVKNELSLS